MFSKCLLIQEKKKKNKEEEQEKEGGRKGARGLEEHSRNVTKCVSNQHQCRRRKMAARWCLKLARPMENPILTSQVLHYGLHPLIFCKKRRQAFFIPCSGMLL